MIRILLAVALLALTSLSVRAVDTTSVDWSNDANTLFRDSSNVALLQGTASVNKDGRLVQLGYFSSGTTANNFLGTWIPLTLTTTIGDSADNSGAGAGRIAFNTFFSVGSNVVQVYDQSLDPGQYTTTSSVTITASTPAQGQVLAIRFYDTTNNSGKYNTVSDDTWLWQTPSSGSSSVNLSVAARNTAGTLEWQDSAHAFQATIVPEPSTTGLALAGAISVGLFGWKLRRRKN